MGWCASVKIEITYPDGPDPAALTALTPKIGSRLHASQTARAFTRPRLVPSFSLRLARLDRARDRVAACDNRARPVSGRRLDH